jgi:hypothetical protein
MHMRFLAPSVVFSLLSAAVVGCGDDTSCDGAECAAPTGGSAGGVAGEGGEGGSGGSGGSAGGGEGGSGGAPTLEHVETQSYAGNDLGGVTVVVSDAAGDIVEVLETDEFGGLLVNVPEGGSLTAVRAYTSLSEGQVMQNRTVQTAFGVPDGGTVRFLFVGDEPPTTYPPDNDPMFIDMAAGTLPAGAIHRSIDASCSYGPNYGPSLSDYNYDGCPGQGTFDLLAIANSASYTPVAYQLYSNQVYTPGSNPSFNPTYPSTAFHDLPITVQGIPSGATRVNPDVTVTRTPGRLQYRHYVNDEDLNAAESYTLRVPNIGFNDWRLRVGIDLGEQRYISHSLPQQTTAYGPLTWNASEVAYLDADPALDVSDPARVKVHYQLSPGDLGSLAVYFFWSPSDNESSYWYAVLPAEAEGEVVMPALPEELAEFVLQVGDTVGATSVGHTRYASGEDTHQLVLENGYPDSSVETTASGAYVYP